MWVRVCVVYIPYYTYIYSGKWQLNLARCYCFSFSKVETAWRGRKLCAPATCSESRYIIYTWIRPNRRRSYFSLRSLSPGSFAVGTASIKRHIISVLSDDDLNNFIIIYYTSPQSRRNFFHRSVVTYTRYLYYNVVFKMILQRGKKSIYHQYYYYYYVFGRSFENVISLSTTY